jgi:hypothetical protein
VRFTEWPTALDRPRASPALAECDAGTVTSAPDTEIVSHEGPVILSDLLRCASIKLSLVSRPTLRISMDRSRSRNKGSVSGREGCAPNDFDGLGEASAID